MKMPIRETYAAARGRAGYEYQAAKAEGGILRALLFFALMFVITATGFWAWWSPWGVILTGAVFLGGLLFSRWWSVVLGGALGFGVYVWLWIQNSPILGFLGGLLGL